LHGVSCSYRYHTRPRTRRRFNRDG
jgi:hypothetical protein